MLTKYTTHNRLPVLKKYKIKAQMWHYLRHSSCNFCMRDLDHQQFLKTEIAKSKSFDILD